MKNIVRFSLESLGVEEDMLSDIKEGQIVVDGQTKSVLGKVVAFKKTPARVLVEDHDKETIEMKDYPDRIDLTLEVEAEATISESDIMLDTFSLKVGKYADCIVGNTKVSGYVIDMDYEGLDAQKKAAKDGENK